MSKIAEKFIKNTVLSLSLVFGASAAFGQSGDINERWRTNAEQVCGSKYESLPADFHAHRSKIRDLVSSTPHGQLILEYAESNEAAICFDTSDIGRAGFFDSTINALVLSDSEVTLKTVKTAAHELRHKWQMDHGFSASTEYTPQHRALVGKVMEADAEAFANLVAWELEQQGHNVRASFPERYDYLPVYLAFQNAVKKDTTPHNAVRSAFDTWFELPIAATHYEFSYLNGFRSFIDDPRVHNHYPISYAYKTMTDEEFLQIGDLLDGSNYMQESGGISVSQSQYIAPLSAENKAILDELAQTIPLKQREFCSTRPKTEQRFCNPYPTKN